MIKLSLKYVVREALDSTSLYNTDDLLSVLQFKLNTVFILKVPSSLP